MVLLMQLTLIVRILRDGDFSYAGNQPDHARYKQQRY